MECKICTNEDIEKDCIKVLSCKHSLCITCYERLIKNECPFCRSKILEKEDNDYDIDYDYYISEQYFDDTIQVDNVLPQSELDYLTYNYEYNSIITTNRRYFDKKKNNFNKTRNRKKGFTSNKNRGEFQRRKKKWKKKNR